MWTLLPNRAEVPTTGKAGRSVAFTAAACGLPGDKVTRIAADYGYPSDPMKMRVDGVPDPGVSREVRPQEGQSTFIRKVLRGLRGSAR
jgi:hypothetical protein